MPSDFQIWEGIFLTFDLAEQKKVEMGFSSNRYISKAKIAASESFIAIAENKGIPLFHKQRFTLLPITISFLLTIKKGQSPRALHCPIWLTKRRTERPHSVIY
jgi:hypothetical protein